MNLIILLSETEEDVRIAGGLPAEHVYVCFGGSAGILPFSRSFAQCEMRLDNIIVP
jgi:hypothetical protein